MSWSRSPERRRWRWGLWLWLSLSACDGCEPEPAAPASEAGAGVVRSWREVRGAGWRTSVPEGWVQEAPGHFVGPGRANALLKVVDNPISMEALADLNRADLLRTSPGYELLSEHRGAVGGAPAWEWVGRLRTPAGTAVVQRTVVIDGGRRKLTITLSARASDFDQNHESFDGIVSSASLVAVDAEGDSP